jgi:hypothetical protein
MPEEDTEMTSAVEATSKRKYGEDDCSTDWVDGVGSDSDSDRRRDSDSDSLDEIMSEENAAAATLVPVGKKQGLDETTARTGKWTTEEEVKLKVHSINWILENRIEVSQDCYGGEEFNKQITFYT